MRGILIALTVSLALATLAHAENAADFFREQEPITPSTLSGRDLDDHTEVLTPQGIVDETDFTLYVEPQPQRAQTEFSEIAPAAGEEESPISPTTPE